MVLKHTTSIRGGNRRILIVTTKVPMAPSRCVSTICRNKNGVDRVVVISRFIVDLVGGVELESMRWNEWLGGVDV